jgi:hypothetical protein
MLHVHFKSIVFVVVSDFPKKLKIYFILKYKLKKPYMEWKENFSSKNINFIFLQMVKSFTGSFSKKNWGDSYCFMFWMKYLLLVMLWEKWVVTEFSKEKTFWDFKFYNHFIHVLLSIHRPSNKEK